MELLIRRGRLVDPVGGIGGVMDILISNGRVLGIGSNLHCGEDAQVIDAKGLVVSGGLVDMHVHLRDPGQEYKETIETGCLAAARGGVTTMACMPNTRPAIDTPELVRKTVEKAEAACGVHVLPIGAVTPAEIAFSILAQIIQEKNKHHAASADRELLQVQEKGVLCLITEKHGSAPRGTGSMMFVNENMVLGSVGGGECEYFVIQHAKKCNSVESKQYSLNNASSTGLDMICGGNINVMFIPV